jgi:hypothetical protein
LDVLMRIAGISPLLDLPWLPGRIGLCNHRAQFGPYVGPE